MEDSVYFEGHNISCVPCSFLSKEDHYRKDMLTVKKKKKSLWQSLYEQILFMVNLYICKMVNLVFELAAYFLLAFLLLLHQTIWQMVTESDSNLTNTFLLWKGKKRLTRFSRKFRWCLHAETTYKANTGCCKLTSKKRKIFFLFLNVGIIELYKGFACFDVTSNINMFISVDF